jgi:hypothetical protein
MSGDFQKELRFLGIESSPAFVRAPEGNGCAERPIHTLKGNLLWVRTFDTVEELRLFSQALTKAHELGADMLVMGAYAHSPLREALLGGVTRHMLAHADLTVLMRH